MNKQRPNPEGDPLDKILRLWNVDAALPPRFQDRVWSRIHRQEEARIQSVSRWWASLAGWLTRVLGQPLGATAYVSAFLLTGGFLGYWGSEHYAHNTEAAWRTAYLYSVTPTLVPQQ